MAMSAASRLSAIGALFAAIACARAAVLPKPTGSAPSLDELAALVGSVPWDSLCAEVLESRCGPIRVDTTVYQTDRAMLDPTVAAVVMRLSSSDVGRLATAMKQRALPSGFSQRMTEGDTVDVSLVRGKDVEQGVMHLIAHIAFPGDMAGYYAHAHVRREPGAQRVLRRWVVEG